jgi:hypothetical protein
VPSPRRVLGFAYPGDVIGLGAQGEHVMNAQATKPTRLRCLPIAMLHHSAAKGRIMSAARASGRAGHVGKPRVVA